MSSSATAANLLTQWSRLFVHSLVEAGVRHVVICPGSRSTPLTWALSQHPEIEIVSLIDERSAAFFALGRAKYTGQPSAVVCTSGSALAHYFPAVIEAAEAHVPLILISADRPTELQHCSAPQTIDQIKLFGDFARAFFDLGMPDSALGVLRALRRTTLQAIATSLTPTPGPVHLNFRARKPLEPIESRDAASLDLEARVTTLLGEPGHLVPSGLLVAAPAQVEFLAARCRAAERGVITLGALASSMPGLGEALAALLEALPFTLFCEATSQIRLQLPNAIRRERVCDAFDLLYASQSAADFAPDFVLQIGAPPTSGAWERFLTATPACELHVIAEHGWPDPSSRATSLTRAALAPTLQQLAQGVSRTRVKFSKKQPSPSWPERLHAANSRAWQTVDAELDQVRSQSPLDEAATVRAVIESLPRGALLALGNSLAVREVDTVFPAGDRGITVWSQRGANGIDGLVSGASGAASQHAGPCVLLLGDISFLHDVGGLWAARSVKNPFVIAVLNNGGGRIFEQLPLMKTPGLDNPRLDLWLTPQQFNLSHAAELYALPSSTVRTPSELRGALTVALSRPGATLLDIQVGAHSADQRRKAMLEALDRALEAGSAL